MPISKQNKALYPPKAVWNKIRADILARAGDCCEVCGIENHVWVIRNQADPSVCVIVPEAEKDAYPRKAAYVVLTIAHLDHDPTNNDYGNLKAMCQLDHNRYDRAHRQANAAITRAAKKATRQTGQLDLFETNKDKS